MTEKHYVLRVEEEDGNKVYKILHCEPWTAEQYYATTMRSMLEETLRDEVSREVILAEGDKTAGGEIICGKVIRGIEIIPYSSQDLE